MYYLGVDLGSLTCDAVLLDGDGTVLASSVVPTGARNREAIARATRDVPDVALPQVTDGLYTMRRERIIDSVLCCFGRRG